MTRLSAQATMHPLARGEGRVVLSGPQVLVKAALESDREIAMIAGPRHEAFASVLGAAAEETGQAILRQHGLALISVPHARRAIALAAAGANAGRATFALVPNAQLDACLATLTSVAASPLLSNGAMCVILEDLPQAAPQTCPRQAAFRLGLPCIEPADLAELREMLDLAMRLSRAGATPAALIVHSSILRTTQTLEMRPNRVAGTVDLVLARRRRKPRWAETAAGRDVMRLARRMELNRARAIPNPGERVPVGFITVGPSDPAVAYVADALDLHGRLPVLQLGLLQPLDDVAVCRLLGRCERVITLEPRPATGAVQAAITSMAETMRHRGERPATIWGRTLPADVEGVTHRLEVDEALHPSTLARKAIHLLHMIRPTVHMAQHLVPPPPEPVHALAPPARGSDLGTPAALALLRRIVTDVDQWLRGQTAQLKERGIEPTALAIDNVDPPGFSAASGRIVSVEFWAGRAFQDAGVAAMRQAARDDRPWIMLICDFDLADNQDLERLIRGVIPAERTDRVSIEFANFHNRAGLRETLENAVLLDRLTVILVRDGPPSKYDLAAIERANAEIDRFGFQPRQRHVRPADYACLFARPAEDDEEEHETDLGTESVRTKVTVDRSGGSRGRGRIRVQPLLEQIEVIRTRPPAWAWRTALSAEQTTLRLELPTPIHRKQPVWRAHIAGFRGFGPGVAAMVLADAGTSMGYDVASIHDPTPIGHGRRGWAQLVFTRSQKSEGTASEISSERIAPERHQPPARRLLATAPYGEADLLLGLDVFETVRAISPSESLRVAQPGRTAVIANCGAFAEEKERELSPAMRAGFVGSLAAVSAEGHRVIEDFASAARTWFYTDRVTDLAMLGIAFQRGLIPVSLEAIEAALTRAQERGFGRSSEAFAFGRHLAVNAKLLTRPRDEQEEDLHSMVRRLSLGLRASRWGGASVARRFEGLVQRSLSAMPGLAETTPGRTAQHDFISAVYRAIEWGGFDYATRFADIVTALYQVDRGETGRSLTRDAILPLAEAMLIHDPIYIATMATSPEQRRLLRQRLNVKHARGDQIERRYLTRVEATLFNRRYRADVRTSDWPARLARALRLLMPSKWRGTRREREIRTFLIDFTQRATYAARADYEQWSDAMHRLHLQASENRLRGMALAELRMLADPGV